MEALTFCKFEPSRSSQISNLDLMCSVIKLSLQHICSFPFGHTMLLVLPTPWGFIMSYTLPFQFPLTLIIKKSVLTNHILSGLRSFLEFGWASLNLSFSQSTFQQTVVYHTCVTGEFYCQLTQSQHPGPQFLWPMYVFDADPGELFP